jgi:enamine deaminase RidA (YjgF/YER057c/UK114 family)
VVWDTAGNLVGKGDLLAHAHQVVSKLRQVLENTDGSLGSVLKITTDITDINNDPAVIGVRKDFFPTELPASMLIVVESLFDRDWLLEIEGIAVI